VRKILDYRYFASTDGKHGDENMIGKYEKTKSKSTASYTKIVSRHSSNIPPLGAGLFIQ